MAQGTQNDPINKVLTVPNLITFVRFLLIPLFLWLFLGAHAELAALVVFVIAACTDWVDGQVARHTGQVSKLGQLFDPFVDRFLLAAGVIAVCVEGRLPLWVLVVLICRDLILLVESRICLYLMNDVPRVSYVGKFATTFLLLGFSLLLLGVPQVSGLGLVDAAWLPGWGSEPALLGIWFVYAGVVLSVTVFCIYQYRGVRDVVRFRRTRELA